jgi:hypothetical protein
LRWSVTLGTLSSSGCRMTKPGDNEEQEQQQEQEQEQE